MVVTDYFISPVPHSGEKKRAGFIYHPLRTELNDRLILTNCVIRNG